MRCFLAFLRCFPALRFPDGSSMVLASKCVFLFSNGVCVCVFFFLSVFFFWCAATFLWILDCMVSVCWRILFCGVVWCHALFPSFLRCFPALRFPVGSSMVLAFEVCFFVFEWCVCVCVFFFLFLCCVCVCFFFFFLWRRSCGFWIVLCPFVGVSSSVGLWSHALFPGLLRCFPTLRFPDDSSIELACAVFFFFFFVCVRRLSCGFWIVWCPFVGVSSSVGLSGLMRCFLAFCAVSQLFGSLMVLQWCWLSKCVFFFLFSNGVCVCFFFFLFLLCGDVPVDFGLYGVRLLAYPLLWGCLVSCAVCWLVALFPGSSVP